MESKITSPISNSSNVKLFDEIPTSIIIDKYRSDLKIDVTRFFTTEKVQIYKCLDTGLLFYYPYEIVGDEQLYADLQKLGSYYSTWNWEHDVVFNLIKPHHKVLEVGCGTGSFLSKLKEHNIEGFGLELNSDAVKVCVEKGLNVYDELLDSHLQKREDFYDVVCSFQVLEHTLHIRDYISECIASVKKGGYVIFGVPNNNPYLYKRDIYHTLNMPPHHMSMWSKEAFESLTGFFDIKMVDVQIEPLYNKRYYLETFLKMNNLSSLNKYAKRIPDGIISKISSIRKWQGRNIVAIFQKN